MRGATALLFFCFVMVASACASSSSDSSSGSSSSASSCFLLTAATCEEAALRPGKTCPPQLSPGVCPSPGVVGCCVIQTPTMVNTTTNTECYYDTAGADTAKPACTGADRAWQTTVP
jgi:hypothetical protein